MRTNYEVINISLKKKKSFLAKFNPTVITILVVVGLNYKILLSKCHS